MACAGLVQAVVPSPKLNGSVCMRRFGVDAFHPRPLKLRQRKLRGVLVTAAIKPVPGLSVTVLPTDTAVEAALCDLVVNGAKEALLAKGAFSLAVPGGRIPTMLSALPKTQGAAEVDWTKCHLYFVNERQNEGKCCNLNRDKFAVALGIPESNIHAPIPGESPASARAYDDELRTTDPNVIAPGNASGAPSLDMALIGLGNDGHIGSVYPNSEAASIHSTLHLVIPVDKPGKQSITMSLAMMAAARRTVIATCGVAKVDAVASALNLSHDSAKWQLDQHDQDQPKPWIGSPSARLAAGPGETVWLLDEEAATNI